MPKSKQPIRIFGKPARAVLAVVSLAGGVHAFRHPALLNDLPQLQFIKGKLQAGAEPWKSNVADMQADRRSSLGYSPKARASVDCGYYENPNNGCTDEIDDATSAYIHALLWIYTGKAEHAAKAAQILDAWSAVLKTHTGENAGVQAAWSSELFPRSAEILKYTYPQWGEANSTRFANMLKSAFLPYIKDGKPTFNGNWELSMIEGMASIAVFTDDQALFDRAIGMWRKRVPAYIYLPSDGALPVRPAGTNAFDSKDALIKYWNGQSVFMKGLSQETCRDFSHTAMGFGAMINTAEIAWNQGLDLYSEFAQRIMDGMEFHAGFLLRNAIPSDLCGGKLNLGAIPTWDVGYNHYHNRMGKEMPLTKKLVETQGHSKTQMHVAFEFATHAALGNAGSVSVLPGARGANAGVGGKVALRPNGALMIWERSGMPVYYRVNGADISRTMPPKRYLQVP